MCYKRKEMNINGVKTKESPRAKNGESERGVIVYVMKILKFMLFHP
jgi:hypothetical protein